MTITRCDLTPGQRAVQSTHAAINFVFEHPGRAGPWFRESNYLVQLEAKNEQELLRLIEQCELKNIKYTAFTEPDLDNQITAIAVEPSLATQKLVSSLPLLFKKLN